MQDLATISVSFAYFVLTYFIFLEQVDGKFAAFMIHIIADGE